MRRFFILLMIVLLPLRGWAGDFMGVQMVTTGMAVHAASAMPPSCPMHAQTEAATPDTAATQAPAAADGCTTCDLCLPMAEGAGLVFQALGFAAHAEPLMAGADFISAATPPTLKPPIS